MNEMLEKKLNNILRTEAQRTLENEKDRKVKLMKMNDIFNLKKILDNYDELEPILKKYFDEKAIKEKWGKEER